MSLSGTSRLEGVGESTGQQYRFRDTFASAENQVLFGETLSFTSGVTTVITTAGPRNNLLAHGTRHLTIDPNGEFRANFDNFSSSECK